MKFNCWDKMSTFIRKLLKVLCPFLKQPQVFAMFSNSQLTYLRAYDEFRKELNFFQLLQTVHKLKACVQVLLEEDSEKLLLIKQIYFQHANIHVKHNQLRKASDVRNFLERDEKKLLYQSQHYNNKKTDPQLLELGVISKAA